MHTRIFLMSAMMISLSLASTAFADQPFNPGQGFEHSGNESACLNAGAGNGGEFVDLAGCQAKKSECSDGNVCKHPVDQDPGNSGGHNNAPNVPPGQAN